ncbi:MAG: sulfotransferase [Bacteroidales bacterium]
MIYIILGMHKSGTTLVSQMLHHSGIDMGDFDVSKNYDDGNKYERTETKQINMSILDCRDAHSLDTAAPVETIPDESGIGDEIKKLVQPLDKKHGAWGFKDPRTCLTYRVWKKYLPAHKIIFVYRHPLEVWHHYQKYISRYNIPKRMKDGWKTLSAWFIYNSLLINEMKNNNMEHIILDYNEFISAPDAIHPLEAFTGRKLVDCRKTELYRAGQKPAPMYNVIKTALGLIKKSDIDSLYDSLCLYRKNK